MPLGASVALLTPPPVFHLEHKTDEKDGSLKFRLMGRPEPDLRVDYIELLWAWE